ncbi:aminotransferase class III-fold pyridoxal phosphate-dependent enzyme [Natronobacterium gregoryi]|uniref:4-aminobutyrate aminotransferase family protein n=2 Tax=Natronobacterium gregoryi TaxID=44930 RepID=L0AMR7_NATGS|nr:aminotransferase class III-fold pyridoxal phosphate-dependent enzyme [Natronobacterium gregoryi]AFZ74492.1 4-aminobutyrate aminotransferase family protein [Natronobacterium gregoryi SP2]ELY72434.1 acetylornithine transaminase [Natronobacterium gregoryi SP2]PLK21762.1 aspartate aminotransferase family protein [Natronobacterium gregoryi SP2]SFI98622.1 4-aminobutyrate aminotransferase [Natronobacterium gregoryi]
MDRETIEPTVETVPGERAKQWVDYHHEFAAPSTYVYEFVWDTTADAVGPFCTDVDGNVLMDFTSHVAAAPLGYNNPVLRKRLEEFDLIDPLKIAGQDFYVSAGGSPSDPDLPGPSQLMERLVDATDHYDMDRVFLSNSGAEAVENAIKICYASGGHRGFTTEGAFHGRTLGALSLNRSKSVHRRGFPEVPGIVSVPYPTTEAEYERRWLTDGPGGNVVADKLHDEQGVIDSDEVAYLILEPIQGEGGYRPAHPRFARDLEDLREEYDLTVIVDEIQSGLGRTGEMWGVDHLDLTPDVISAGKGLRVGATISRSDVFPEEKSRLSSTWGAGDVVASMQGALTFDVIHEQDLLANARNRGEQLHSRLEDAVEDRTELVDVRGRGLMIAIEFDTKDRREAVVEAAFERGLLMLGCGHKTLRLLPPLDVTEREIDLALALLFEAIDAVDADLA